MNTLSSYISPRIENLHAKHGAFYAFSQKQFDENKQEGTPYKQVLSCCYVPRDNVLSFIAEYEQAYTDAKNEMFQKNTREEIILKELENHEAFETFDTSDAFYILSEYGITQEEVNKVFHANKMNYV